MTNLRWVLLLLGILVLLGIYVWGQGWLQRFKAPIEALRRRPQPARQARVEPKIQADTRPPVDKSIVSEPQRQLSTQTEKIITLRFVPAGGSIACDRVILALRAAGLKHGRYGIFHMHADDFSDEPLFSVANLTEPGSFDLTHLADTTIPGMSFFMLLPGVGNAIDRFDRMVATARRLGRELDAELRDEKGSSWSIQRERYVREEIIEYQHLLDKPLPD